MNKFFTVALMLALSVTSAYSAGLDITVQEAKAMIKEGKVRKLSHRASDNLHVIGEQLRTESSASDIFFQKTPAFNTDLNRMSNAPSRVTPTGAQLYGFLNGAQDQVYHPIGLYEFEPTGIRKCWADIHYLTENYSVTTGFHYNGQFIGAALYSFMGYVFGYSQLVQDFETGDIISKESFDYSDPNVIVYDILAHNTIDNCVYGMASTPDHKWHWYRTTPYALGTGEDLGEIPGNLTSLCFNCNENAFFAINDAGELIKITNDGKVSTEFKIDTVGDIRWEYYSSIAYSPNENVYYCSLRSESASYMFILDPTTKKTSLYFPFLYGEHFRTLMCLDQVSSNPKSPLAPVLDKISFPNGELSGTISYIMPTEAEDGSELTGTIHVFPSVSGKNVGPADGYEAAPGETVTVEYTDVKPGRNIFNTYVVHDGLRSTTLNVTRFIGNDVPNPPARVTISPEKISWTKVSSSENGGFLAKNEIEYEVYLNDEFIGTTKKNSYDYQLPTDSEYSLYTASVIATCRGERSKPTYSRSLAYGRPYDLPVHFAPTEQETTLCTVINCQNDGGYWWYNPAYKAWISACPSSTPKGEDWIILPPVNIDSADKYYTLEFDLAKYSRMESEQTLEVFFGNEPTIAAMTNVIMTSTTPDVLMPDYDHYSMIFKPGQEGPCYIGFRSINYPDNNAVMLQHIKVEDYNITAESPQEVYNMTLEGADNGVLEAYVSFNLPRRTVTDVNIDKNTEIKAVVECDGQVTVTGKPGQRVSTTVKTKQGINTINIVAYIDEFGSLPVRGETYTGVVVPVGPTVVSVEVSADMKEFTLTWDPVDKGVENGYVNPDDITYAVYLPKYNLWGNESWNKYMDIGKVTSYTYPCPEDIKYMDYVRIGIAACNAAGDSRLAVGQTIMGNPYPLPMIENFNNGTFDTSPWVSRADGPEYYSSFTLVNINDVIQTDETGMVLLGIGKAGYKGRLSVPRFNTEGQENVSVTLKVYSGPDATPFTVYGGIYKGGGLRNLGSFTPSADSPEFSEVTFDMPEDLIGKYWVQIYIDPEFETDENMFMLKSFSAQAGSSVDEMNINSSIRGVSGGIEIIGHDGDDIVVSDINGMVVSNSKASSDRYFVEAKSGLYVVKAGNQIAKVVVL